MSSSTTSKVIVAGSRDYTDEYAVYGALMYYLSSMDQVEIVSGGARGVDKAGESFAAIMNWPVKVFPYKSELGKAGGPVRNKEMAEYGTHLIAFWDGKSKGTKDMIAHASREGLAVRVIRVDYPGRMKAFRDLWWMSRYIVKELKPVLTYKR